MIEGLKIVENYITKEEEKALLEVLRLSTSVVTNKKRNSIKRYGSKLPYNSRMKSEQVPEYFEFLCKRLVNDGFHVELPDSVTVNEYREGQGITYHYDSQKSGAVISVVSLLGGATMGMSRGSEEKKFEIPARTLVTMSGEARNDWKHCIFPVTSNRISIVFRKGTKL